MGKNAKEKYASSSSNRLIPKTILKKFSKAVRVYFNYAQDVITLPKSLYYAFFTLLVISTTFPLLLVQAEEVWVQGSQYANILKLISFFWRWGAVWISYESVLISSILIIGLYAIFIVPNFFFSLIYFYKGRISRGYCYFTCLANDIMLPAIVIWMSSELGCLVNLFFHYRTKKELISICLLFTIIAILLFIQMAYSHCLIFPQLNYQEGRSILWLSSSNTFLYCFTILQLFFTHSIELINNKPFRILFIILEIFLSLILFACTFLYNPIVKMNLSIMLLCLLEATFVIFVFGIMQIFGIEFDSNIIILLFFAMIFLGLITSYIHLRNTDIKAVKVYDELLMGVVSFEECFKSPTAFLHLTRSAFKKGHPYVFTWKTFITAIEKFPNSGMVWMQFLRYLAIYYDDLGLLIKYTNHFSKDFPKKSIQTKTFLFYIRKCINSRNRHLNSDLAARFRIIDAKIRRSNSLMVNYWSSIENDAPSLAYALCKKLYDNFADIESYFSQLIMLYPNNSHICTKFAAFLLDYSNDPRRAEFYQKNARFLSEQESYTVDITAQCAFEMFPMIPRNLEEIHRLAESDLISILSDDSASHSKSMSLRSTGSITTGPQEILDDDFEDTTASRIRFLGMTASVPFIRNMMIASFLFFFITYLGGSFSPPFIVLAYLNKFNAKFTAVSRICEILYLIDKTPNYLFEEAMTIINAFPMKDDENSILVNNTSELPFYVPNSQLINEMTVELNNLIHQFNSMYGSDISTTSKIGRHMTSKRIKLVSHMPDNEEFYYYDSLVEALDSICASFFSYSSTYSTESINYLNETWFTNAIVNSRTISSALIELSSLICNDVISLLNEFTTIIIAIVSIFGFMCIIFLPILLYNIDKISVGWGIIMHTIQSLPRISIQTVISKITRLNQNRINPKDIKEPAGNSKDIIKDSKDLIINSKGGQKLTKNNKENCENQNTNTTSDNNTLSAIDLSFSKHIYTDQKKLNRTYDKYTNMFIQMGSSKDISSIVVINRHYALAVFNFFLALVALFIVSIIVIVESNKLIILPYRLCLSSNLNAVMSVSITDILRLLALENNLPFRNDTRESLYQDMTEIANKFESNLNDFMFDVLDGQIAGVITSSANLVDQLLLNNGKNWLNQTILHDRLVAMPSIMIINLLYQQLVRIVERSSRFNDTFTSYDYDILLYIHIINNHIDQEVFNQQIKETFYSLGSSTTKSLNVTIFSISAALLCIGICMGIFIEVNMKEILNTVHFCLSSLAMIEPKFLKDSNKVMLMLNGEFSATSAENDSILNSFQVAEQKIVDAIIVIDNDFSILSINQIAKSLFYIDDQMTMQYSLSNFFIFGNKMKLADLINSDKDEITIETTVGTINTDEELPMRVSVCKLPDKLEYVCIFQSLEINERKMIEIREIEKQINALKYRVMPPAVLDRVNSSKQMTLHNIIIVVVNMCDFNDYSQDKSALDLRTRFRNFFDVIENEIKTANDALKLRNLGVVSYVVFNMVKDSPNNYDTAKDALDFCKRVSKSLKEKGIAFRIGMAHDKTARAGMISDDRLLFDVYARGMQVSYSLARKADPMSLIVCNRSYEFLPPNEAKDSQQVQLSIMGNPMSLYHKFIL
ncbi:hypothetical protein TRFO_29790 [Tritrichomonas foetus]|uniref:Guanylate cyclase domain-containing protein n=1 Tax=Tritrichomonas foetus TaxID=1144522 RepID=A0A1J4JZP7_9EUKA|nr:hypothetical protein TRFO_29790 [Tritrichomonas foetus]|eukprot:OHT02966.1 hypothetical protein TRFO_29790 [Tritrichomonas foetus]